MSDLSLESVFQPIVVVYDSGKVTVDWTSSYIETVFSGNADEASYDDPHGHAELLDIILGSSELSDAEKLRRLADYMEESVIHDPFANYDK